MPRAPSWRERGFASTPDDIRRSRQEILALADGEPAKNVANNLDFFTTSECRDMLFHVQEHQMTLPEIADFVGANNLTFLGFIADGGLIHRFRTRYPHDEAVTDLALWHAFEMDNPGAFAGMYQFWIRKDGWLVPRCGAGAIRRLILRPRRRSASIRSFELPPKRMR